MNLVEQEVKVWGECPTDILEAKLWIERAGRTCYNSPMPEAPNPDKFLDKVMANDPPHSSMFEHSNLVLGLGDSCRAWDITDPQSFLENDSRWISIDNTGEPVVFGNFRAFMEATNSISIDSMLSKVLSEGFFQIPAKQYSRLHRRITVELHTDRNVLAEITRHRDDVGFSVRSQRYVDEQGKMEFVKPSWWNDMDFIQQETFILSCKNAELNYNTLRKTLPPQHARVVLNGQCKTVIVMTAYLPEWDWVFKLRRSPAAYPQMRALMNMVYDQFVELGYAQSN